MTSPQQRRKSQNRRLTPTSRSDRQPGRPNAAVVGAPAINKQLTTDEIQALHKKLDELRLEHRDLDDVIHHLNHGGYPDQLQIKRLKKRKLRLKDMIDVIESRLIPDIDA